MPATVETTPCLPGLSPVAGKPVLARFDGEMLSSDGGLLALREVEKRLGIAAQLAACIDDPRTPERVQHGLDEIIRFRMLMIAAGYEDGNDADRLRNDPMFKLAMERLPEAGDLCSQATISRTENLPGPRALLRMGLAMVEHYCASFRTIPNRVVLDIDDTFDAAHGAQQLCLFNAHHDEYGFQPIVVFDGDGRMLAAVLRPACRPKGAQIVKWLRRLIDAIRSHWPRTAIMLRGDSHYCTPEVLRFCRARRLDYIFGVAPTTTLRKHVIALEASTTARAQQAPGEKIRRFKEFNDGAASWDRVERIIARVEAGPLGVDTRFIVTSLKAGSPRTLYQEIYCARGQAENHIKAWKTHLAADRTSCSRASANQMRLFLHIGAYWLMWSLRSLMPRRSRWRGIQFDTLRLRLIKLAVRLETLKRSIRLHLPRSMPDQAILGYALARLPRLVI
ncbi:putative transposase for insertion sequence element (plasmid) [Acidiphilium multivorum AIU301]|uniref:Putative transposase for insertion sequence element n=3 Tax=Acidiphilium multivorum TaxID=62140 RepID=F0J4D5_ACIMA|nr:IS1380 family transposase [Acidiphilium multivorum]BAJ79987.1 putative transposase for insertion sequence element [Acidiphilium multivorum AIU301]BAJ82939.1 putative transposase for insertion sequence element [Acidiphilium multivorum AIU301]BAJ82942.1 putative transposase for insertion sequence element [Acidiphilium multivorum AIU301]